MTPKEAREKLQRALKTLNEVRTGMGLDLDRYTSDDCHAVAMAQYATHQAIEQLEFAGSNRVKTE